MKTKERLDRILNSCRDRMQEEVSALLGKDLTLGEPQTKIATKEECFEEPAGKSVLAHIKLEGDLEGKGCLLVPVQDAIRIGGTLIMLPDSELQTVISDKDYTEELEDSYGEVANILCGSLTSTFEEQYPKTFRLVRTEQEVILPAKVDVDSDQPIPADSYYCSSFSMQMGEEKMGKLELLLPAGPFGLVESGAADDADSADKAQEKVVEATGGVEQQEVKAAEKPQQENGDKSQASTSTAVKTTAPVSRKESEKQKKIIDGILKNCTEKIGEEVGALVGSTMKITAVEMALLSKGDLLEQAGGKQVLTRMDIRGEEGGEAFLFTGMPGAIHLGGSLIMLPDSELEETVRNEEFGEDAQDAFGEITNILAGVLTYIFEEQHKKKYGFVKSSMETVVPIKIDPDGDDVVPNQLYYLCAGKIEFDGKDLGRLQLFFPATLFGLEGLAAQVDTAAESAAPARPGEEAAVGDSAGGPRTAEASGGASPRSEAAVAQGGGQQQVSDILIFSDDDTNGQVIADLLRGLGYLPSVLPFKSSVNEKLTPSVRMVFLVMREISEQGFGMAIKITSAGYNIPLVAAGPAWTRSLVIKAVKYGAVDILITPATEQDIREKVEMNLVNMAA